jgi:hypothetical protein
VLRPRYPRAIEDRVSDRLAAVVRSEFEAGSVEPVLARLTGLNLPFIQTAAQRERVQAAVVLLAAGDYAAFERSAEQAEIDWRDVLVAAGLAHGDWPERLDEQLKCRAL